MNKLFLIVLIVLFPTTYGYSKTLSSGPFYFAGGTIPSKNENSGILNLSTASLPENGSLNVTCDIENPNFSHPYPVVIEFYNGSLNGVISPSNQYLLDHQINKYHTLLTLQQRPRFIRFTNYDDTDAVFVKNCIAVYATD
jgi:hypothetical protein